MTREVIALSQSASAESAASVMVTQSIGCVIIIDDSQKPLGIVTERDLVTKVVATNQSAKIKLKDIMTTPLIKIYETSSLSVAARHMLKHNIKRLPVINHQGILNGVLTSSDILRETISDSSLSEEEMLEYIATALSLIRESDKNLNQIGFD